MGTNRNITDEKWAALAKHLYDEPTAESSNPFPEELAEDEWNQIRQTARQVDLHIKQKKFSAEKDYALVRAKIQPDKKEGTYRITSMWTRIAAVLVVGVILGTFVLWSQYGGQVIPQKMVAQDQYGLQKIVLADGSVVTLNYGSSLDYPAEFDADKREVTLQGEGFFEVTPNPQKPFVIHAGKANIRVLGTSFNVNANSQNEEVSVVVKTGKVSVWAADNVAPEDIVLLSGEKGVLSVGERMFVKSRNNDANYLAWKTHSFIFEKTSLKDVIEQLCRVYRVEITTADSETSGLLLTARFDDRSIGFILEVIAMTHGLEIEKADENHYRLGRN